MARSQEQSGDWLLRYVVEEEEEEDELGRLGSEEEEEEKEGWEKVAQMLIFGGFGSTRFLILCFASLRFVRGGLKACMCV